MELTIRAHELALGDVLLEWGSVTVESVAVDPYTGAGDRVVRCLTDGGRVAMALNRLTLINRPD
ncbi:MAG: hypothetical protein L0H93_21085 [Nocardioides sp.]|nr:hypothetical protein [Nocardioides sp.]